MIGMIINRPKSEQRYGVRFAHYLRNLAADGLVREEFSVYSSKESETGAKRGRLLFLLLLPYRGSLGVAPAGQAPFAFGRAYEMKLELAFQEQSQPAHSIGNIIGVRKYADDCFHLSALPLFF